MSFFDDEEDLQEGGLCDPDCCRFCQAKVDDTDDEEDEDAA